MPTSEGYAAPMNNPATPGGFAQNDYYAQNQGSNHPPQIPWIQHYQDPPQQIPDQMQGQPYPGNQQSPNPQGAQGFDFPISPVPNFYYQYDSFAPFIYLSNHITNTVTEQSMNLMRQVGNLAGSMNWQMANMRVELSSIKDEMRRL